MTGLVDTLFSLDARVALVTGASSGVGRAIAESLALAGASVVLVARRQAELDAACNEIAAAGGRAASVAADLANRDEIGRCAARAADAFGPPDILVSAAGVNLRAPLLEVTEPQWDATLRINLDAPFLLAQKLAPAMIERRWG
ncbi:MAG TPA: SDR family NAD(P)-dependent oxidoreductase, partial [Burkholderiaceae bacterium]|nr:SDR family NAD(P)-dependent oxidoreductase [Burkholderiaceae bacterium]